MLALHLQHVLLLQSVTQHIQHTSAVQYAADTLTFGRGKLDIPTGTILSTNINRFLQTTKTTGQ